MPPGQIIKIFRTASKISQSEFASKLNVTRPYLSQIENGKSEPSMTLLKETSKLLNIPLPLLIALDAEGMDKEVMQKLRKIFSDLLMDKLEVSSA